MSLRPSNWEDLVSGTIYLLITIAALSWVTLVIVHQVTKPWHPPVPPAPFDAKTEFVKSCKAASGPNVTFVPDVHTDKWTCIREAQN